MQVLTDRSPLLTQIFSTDCRDALGQMLEAQVCYLHRLKFNCVVPNFTRSDFFCFKQICGSGSAWTLIILGSRIRIWIWIRIKVIKPKFMESRRLKVEPWRFGMEPWRVSRPVIADLQHLMRSSIRILRITILSNSVTGTVPAFP
jgi:hypothetical protein